MPAPSKGQHVLAKLRQVLKLGQKELAKRAQCSQSAIQRIELGKLKLSETLARKIVESTGVALPWLLESDLTKPPLDWHGRPLTRESSARLLAHSRAQRPTARQLKDFGDWVADKSFGLAGEPIAADDARARLSDGPPLGPLKPVVMQGKKIFKIPKRFNPDAIVAHVRTLQGDYFARRDALRLLEKAALFLGRALGHKDRLLILYQFDEFLKQQTRKRGVVMPDELSLAQIKSLITWLESLQQIRSQPFPLDTHSESKSETKSRSGGSGKIR